jgi:hypothetical protein
MKWQSIFWIAVPGLTGAFFLAVGAVLTWANFRQDTVVNGEVLTVQDTSFVSRRSRGRRIPVPKYLMEVQYQISGSAHLIRVSLPKMIPVGTVVPVRVQASHPRNANLVVDEEARKQPTRQLLLGLVLQAIAGLVFWSGKK